MDTTEERRLILAYSDSVTLYSALVQRLDHARLYRPRAEYLAAKEQVASARIRCETARLKLLAYRAANPD